MAVVAEVGDIFTCYCGNIESRTMSEKFDEQALRLLVDRRGPVRARLAFTFHEVLEPLSNAKHAQPFTANSLQHFAQKFPCPRLSQCSAPRFVRCLLQGPRYFQRLAFRGQAGGFFEPPSERISIARIPIWRLPARVFSNTCHFSAFSLQPKEHTEAFRRCRIRQVYLRRKTEYKLHVLSRSLCGAARSRIGWTFGDFVLSEWLYRTSLY